MDARPALVMSLLCVLAACGGKAPAAAGPSPDAAPPEADAQAQSQIAPAIIPPDEVADPTEPPSYEVAVASAAATRNQALAQCKARPESVRTQCEQEANAAFADVQKNLENLRGNTQ